MATASTGFASFRPKALNGISGSISLRPASPANHGQVVVRDDYHFAYDDGCPNPPFGTTAYAWSHQAVAQQKRTLETLANTAFTNLRMCLFPTSFMYNAQDPELYPFERTPTMTPGTSLGVPRHIPPPRTPNFRTRGALGWRQT
jgi:hypothetical protein